MSDTTIASLDETADAVPGVPALEVRQLTKHFTLKAQLPWQQPAVVRAVDGVDLTLMPGRTLGIVGESGCGKSTLARLIVRLETPNSGSILVHGEDISTLSGGQGRLYSRQVQMVFQDPYSSLDSRMTVGDCVMEPLTVQHLGTRSERREIAAELLEKVGLNPSFAARYPGQMSGGQRQRVAVARALALSPSVIVADEPTSALDLSVRAQVINLLRDLQEDSNLAYAFISHDLATVRHIAHDVAVMYLGQIVETAPSEELFDRPLHPYTQALLDAVPIPDPVTEDNRSITLLAGDPPSPIDPPSGCRFHPRCPIAQTVCSEQAPPLVAHGPNRTVACHFAGALDVREPGSAQPVTLSERGRSSGL